MITPRQKRSAAARRVALGLIVAGTLVGVAPAHADPTHTYTNHKPLSGNYPGSYTTRAADSSPTGALAAVSQPAIPEPQAGPRRLPRQLHQQPIHARATAKQRL